MRTRLLVRVDRVVGAVLRVVLGFGLGWWASPEAVHEAGGVVPVDPRGGAFRVFTVIPIPIAIVLASIGGYRSGGDVGTGSGTTVIAVGGTGLVFLPALLMIVFRQKYPRWWFDWNLELLRVTNRVGVYLALMDDHYPSTDEQQSVHLDFGYPDAKQG